MSKNILVKVFLLLALLSINMYAVNSSVPKPIIDRVFNYKGTWYIRYQDVILNDDEATERVVVNGVEDRVVNIGNSAERGFSLTKKTYDATACNELVIEIYNGHHKVVSQSDVFQFGDVSKCNVVTPVAKPVIDRIFNYKGTWYIRYQDVNVAFDDAYEEMVVNGVVDRVIQNGQTDERGFSLSKSYDATACNEGEIKIYDGLANVVAQSEIFNFGDLTKCGVMAPELIIKKTGQIQSYVSFDDGYYQKGVTPNYIRDNDKEIVTDTLTGLMWQDDATVATVKKQWLIIDNVIPPYTDTSGDTATTYCNELSMGGYTDWRLPTFIELEGIIDYGTSSPAIDVTFQNKNDEHYWSNTSTSFHGEDALVQVIDFTDGMIYRDFMGDSAYIRCVRTGQ